jgi:uncharacterized NAD(P)/FAD-binding protein YdhS
MQSRPVIVIVGAGYCGVVSAILLLRSSLPAGTRLVLLERPGHGIGGVAYDPPSERLLLNVPADRMSAFQDAPSDFVEYLAAAEPGATAATFARRRVYGRYLAARLDAAAFGRDSGVRFEPTAAEVLDVMRMRDGRWHVVADAGTHQIDIAADAVLLATGATLPQAPRWLAPWMLDEARFVEAWSPDHTLPAGADTVVAIGTGLTFVDQVVELRAGGFQGRIVAVSRHGRLPRPNHGTVAPPDSHDLPPEIARNVVGPPAAHGLTTRELTRAIARHALDAGRRGGDYRAVISALRPHASGLWARLADTERMRFLRHARALWDIHRHRMPDELANVIAAEQRAGSLDVLAGRVVSVDRSATGLTVAIRRRGADAVEQLGADRIINCTGAPAHAPLGKPWHSLLERRLARRDALGIGVLTDPAGRLLDASGAALQGLHYAGPLWRAQDWEMTAVPELRARLPAVAAAIADNVVRYRNLA